MSCTLFGHIMLSRMVDDFCSRRKAFSDTMGCQFKGSQCSACDLKRFELSTKGGLKRPFSFYELQEYLHGTFCPLCSKKGCRDCVVVDFLNALEENILRGVL